MPGNHFLLCPGRENPLGRTELPNICDANRMVARSAAIEPEKVLCCFEVCCRTALVMLLIHWCGGSWILEQPASSLMQEHPAVAAASAKCQYYKINAFLGAYRHWSWKLCSFYSNKLLDCIASCCSIWVI